MCMLVCFFFAVANSGEAWYIEEEDNDSPTSPVSVTVGHMDHALLPQKLYFSTSPPPPSQYQTSSSFQPTMSEGKQLIQSFSCKAMHTNNLTHTHTPICTLHVHVYTCTHTTYIPYSWKFSRVPIFMNWSTQRVFAVTLSWIAEYLSHIQ